MKKFGVVGNKISQFLKENGLIKPTPIQQKAIPQILASDENFLLLAPTGSGKTEAALLPLVHRLYKMSLQRELFGIYILYITPLRALNRDVFNRIEGLCDYLGLSVSVRHGDTTQYARRKQALRPPNLLVTTPETLQAILPAKRMGYHLKTVFAVIVDEIHELADSKRGAQMSIGLERLERKTGHKIQRIGLSATVGNPNQVAQLLSGSYRAVKSIWAGYGTRQTDMSVEMPLPTKKEDELAKKISYPPHSAARLVRVVDLVSTHKSTIVYTNTRSFAETLGSKMRATAPPFDFDVHHGSLSKGTRLDAEKRLKDGTTRAIIATSSLELGIDIGHTDLVVQYSSPRQVSRALQRIGRAGHSMGRVAKGVLIATKNLDDVAECGVILRRSMTNKVENAQIQYKAWDVLCHQIAGIVMDDTEIRQEGLHRIIKGAYPFEKTTMDELESLIEFMVDRRIVKYNDGSVSWAGKTREYYYKNLSTIPDIRQIHAIDIATRTSIGVLDEDYVTEHVETGSVFVIRGRPWNVVTVDEENEEVLCAPAASVDTEAPRWVGEMIPVPFEVASEVAKVLKKVIETSEREARTVLKGSYGISGDACNYLVETAREGHAELGQLPLEDRIVIEDFGSGVVMHAPFGTKANEGFGVVIAALLTTQSGTDVAVESDPYRILLSSETKVEPNAIVDILDSYSGEQATTILRLAMRHTQTLSSRFVHVARRMSVIRRNVSLKEIPVKKIISIYESTPLFDEAMREVLNEKLDEDIVRHLFDGVTSGEIDVTVVKTQAPSTLARLIIDTKTRFEVMGELTDEDEVLKVMEERLLSKRFRLVCCLCGWNSVRTVSTLEDTIQCPACESIQVAALRPNDKDFTKIVKKHVRGETLSTLEKKRYQSGTLNAELVARYGKRALLVLAGRGIGAKTASRVLSPGLKNRLELLRAISAAEKQYARTRPFWSR